MAGLKRRARVEGWALDIPNADEAMDSSFMQRLADSNKLWFVAFAVVVVVAGFLLVRAKQQASLKNEDIAPAPRAQLMFGSYDDKPHNQFADDFRKDNASVLEARFEDGVFVIVVRADASADEIEYMSRTLVAEKNRKQFKNRIVVEVYRRNTKTGADTHVCTTKWDDDAYGFVSRFDRAK